MIKFDSETLRVMGLFESMTGAALKDCIVEQGVVTFFVEQGEAAKAIGRQGNHARALEQGLKRKIKIVEFNPEIQQFVRNLVAPIPVAAVKLEGEIVGIVPGDNRSRGIIIGRNATNLRHMEDIVKRYFPIKEIKVSNVP